LIGHKQLYLTELRAIFPEWITLARRAVQIWKSHFSGEKQVSMFEPVQNSVIAEK
jgi:hypothetical protein